MKEELTEPLFQVLQYMGSGTPGLLYRPGDVGCQLWGKKYRQPQHYARPAGKLLNRLKALGMVEWTEHWKSWGWCLTHKGRETVRLELRHRGIC